MQESLKHDLEELKKRYETIALEEDDKTTASDFNLRELEIDTASQYIKDGDILLDIGSGTGYTLRQYASRFRIQAHGIDYAENMITTAKKKLSNAGNHIGTVEFKHASVTEIPFSDNYFDVVTSSRCLMALLDWETQKQAITEVWRVLKPGGTFVMMEGTLQGVNRLNRMRNKFGLSEIDPSGRDRLYTLKFDEEQLIQYCLPIFDLAKIERFGMYYFLTRIVHPLLVAPDNPKYDAHINTIARLIASEIPDYKGLGHLVAFVWEKHAPA